MTAEKETVGFEWSEGGLRLLSLISTFVDNNGGNFKLADAIEAEWAKGYRFVKAKYEHRRKYRPKWTDQEIQLLIDNQALMPYKVSRIVGRSVDAVEQMRVRLIAQGLIKRKRDSPYAVK